MEIFHDEGVLNEEISTQIVSSLNEICPYIDQVVLIGGMALVPEIDLEEIEVSDESWRYSVASGYHRGVGILIPEGHRPTIIQRIETGHVNGPMLATSRKKLDVFQCFTNEAVIVPLLEIEEDFNPYYLTPETYDPAEGVKFLSSKSNELVRILSDTRFRRMDKNTQNKIVESIIDEASKKASLTGYELTVSADYGLTTEIASEGKIGLTKIPLKEFIISGTCLSIDSIERLQLHRRRIVNDHRLIDKWAGLCLVVDPDVDTRQGLELNSSQVIYLPLSSQELEIDFSEPA